MTTNTEGTVKIGDSSITVGASDSGGSENDEPNSAPTGYVSSEEYVAITGKLDESFEVQENRPIRAVVTHEDNDNKVFIPELEVYAYADSVEDGRLEVIADIVLLCEQIYDAPDESLGLSPRQWKQYLHEHIRRNG